MSKQKLQNGMKEKYGLTNMEVDDIMRYMIALCKEYAVLANRYKTEHLVELKTHNQKAIQAKAEKYFLAKIIMSVVI